MKKFLITTIIIAFSTVNFANAQKKKPDNKIIDPQIINRENKTIEKAKTWITLAVAGSLNKANGLAENTNDEAEGKHQEIYTAKYMAYKDDAMNVDMDGGMSLKAFTKKWTKDFSCKYAGIGVGYLVPGQDYGLIKVTRCDFTKKIGNAYLFGVTIRDTEAKIDYKRDIKVIPSGNVFLIEDVLEYN
ncbi:hypothetical protein [Pedobacter nototheniae]|uniref:hypothetical protein n=1 Tax=Pedobacter nototheniae TaxID=2488994 RepID=UPI00292F4344|nr:hypothetical protein [Pedobacter nototheniae]